MLISGILANQLQSFIDQVNKTPVQDQEQAIINFCKNQELLIYNAILSLQITIPPGVIVVTTPSGPATNSLPVVINNLTCAFN